MRVSENELFTKGYDSLKNGEPTYRQAFIEVLGKDFPDWVDFAETLSPQQLFKFFGQLDYCKDLDTLAAERFEIRAWSGERDVEGEPTMLFVGDRAEIAEKVRELFKGSWRFTQRQLTSKEVAELATK